MIMKKNIIFFLFVCVIVSSLSVSAELTQQTNVFASNTTVVLTTQVLSTNDFGTGDSATQIGGVAWQFIPSDFAGFANAGHAIDRITFSITHFVSSVNGSSLQIVEADRTNFTFMAGDPALLRGIRYFFTLHEHDSLLIQQRVFFASGNSTVVGTYPFGYEVVTESTFSDFACIKPHAQELEQSFLARESFIGQTERVFTFTTSLIALNFEIWAILFWIIKIVIGILAVIALLYSVIWLYDFVNTHLGKGKR
jgi:hypothetical protein